MYFLTIRVIKKLEEVGFLVDRSVGDNAKVNVKLFKILRKSADKNDFRVTHPAEPSKTSRKWYVSYHPTHILKKERNQLLERNLKWEGEKIDFSLIKLLFAKTLNDGLPLCRFLTRRHIDPTNFEKNESCLCT